ncbi:hypothetical protein [Cupriavidus sp.]|nr:hypothetical protein [Cupriavidus sp.]
MKQWLESAAYLPRDLRDFHNQKDLFKAMHDTVSVDSHSIAGHIDWVQGQCYVIDVFLWFMAQHGYTLQRSSAKVDFRDLAETVTTSQQARNASVASIFARTATGERDADQA